MKYFVFRNDTIERFFAEAEFSGYEDVSYIPEAERYVWFYLAPVGHDAETTAAEIRHYADLLRLTLGRLPQGRMALLLTMQPLFGVHTVTSDFRVREAVEDYNRTLRELAVGQVKLLDFSSFASQYAAQDLFDWKYYFLSQMGLNPRLAAPFKAWFTRQVEAVEQKRRKCLVLDLDNTLWGGVLGEDGVEGVQLGGSYPGKAFLLTQKMIAELGRQGVILAVCSKNNLEDVRDLWQRHPDCVLKEEHFACLKINWNNKADNIRELASELNIGLDSLVFIDDNPTERALVQSELPMVAVPDFPEQPYLLPPFLKEVAERYFSTYALTDEDRAKTAQYKANAQRASAQARFTNMEEYIRSLEIVLTVTEANEVTLPRVAQMTQKTNQFNLTTRRYTDADLRAMLERGWRVFVLSVRDRFGDSGITGCAIVEGGRIDSFLLSCRILGKEIERAFLSVVLMRLKESGVEQVQAQYLPTAKNGQVRDFYDRCGFLRTSETDYALDLRELDITLSNNYKYEIQ